MKISERQVVVVGAGPAGIAIALALKDAGLHPLVLDQADKVGSSWHGHYEQLRLNTSRSFSHLPGRRFAKGTATFPSRDQLIEHLSRHAREDGIDLQLSTRVERIEPDDCSWVLDTSAGAIRAPQVVVATGYKPDPWIPAWNGSESFRGRLLHSSEYKHPKPFRNMKALVVGPGCSGMEIAYDLATRGATKVWLSARTPPNIFLREGPRGALVNTTISAAALLARLPPHGVHPPGRLVDAVMRLGRRIQLGDLSEFGLPVPEEGMFGRLYRDGVSPTIVDEEVIEAIKGGWIEVVRGVQSLDASGVRFSDGARVEPDVVICATGYQSGLKPLVGHLPVLDQRGLPRSIGRQPAASGLRFIGYARQLGELGYMGKEAKRAAKAIVDELRAPRRRSSRPAAQRVNDHRRHR